MSSERNDPMDLLAGSLIPPQGGRRFAYAGIDGRWTLTGHQTQGLLAVACYADIPPRRLAAPLHRHSNEDEYCVVLEGRLGVLVGDELLEAEPGAWVRKPRGVWHTFWNAGEGPCSVVEVVVPAGIEDFFDQAAEAREPEGLAEIAGRHGMEIDLDSVAELCARFGLRFPGG